MNSNVCVHEVKPWLHLEEDREQWREDCRLELLADHENEVFLKFVLLSGILGFKQVSIGIELPTSVAQPAFCYFANFASDWQQKFVERHAKHHGAKVAHKKRTVNPPPGVNEYYWVVDDFQWEADANGIVFDHDVVMPGSYGTVAYVGMAGFGEAADDYARALERAAILIEMTIESMRCCLVKKYLPQALLALRTEEKQYLSWVLDGKTTAEIIEITNEDKTTIAKLQKNLPPRFDRNSVFAAAVLALRMGMLA